MDFESSQQIPPEDTSVSIYESSSSPRLSSSPTPEYSPSRRRSDSASQAGHSSKKKQRKSSRQHLSSSSLIVKGEIKHSNRKKEKTELDHEETINKMLSEDVKGGSVLERKIRSLWDDVNMYA